MKKIERGARKTEVIDTAQQAVDEHLKSEMKTIEEGDAAIRKMIEEQEQREIDEINKEEDKLCRKIKGKGTF